MIWTGRRGRMKFVLWEFSGDAAVSGFLISKLRGFESNEVLSPGQSAVTTTLLREFERGSFLINEMDLMSVTRRQQ